MVGFARAHGFVDLTPDADTWTWAAVSPESGRVVLTVDEKAAYRRLTDGPSDASEHGDNAGGVG